ncbi:CheR family methyltransferase [Occallatibacter riparius]|uniref:protein-glutamate O-methyltransferase n=1 Tax=Occallatibacter riparius TaxID=1002689 RepID=A0A9J7BVP0_9BACT|nr:CheR family methyltransferase [Occallatibacter riparius]UWZ86939.1 PAS domain-containing protein [Occallatibacter riparius]
MPANETSALATEDSTQPSQQDPSPNLPFAPRIESAGEEQQAPALMYPVVGFGASAGGLDSLREILENLDPNTGMAFVLVTHMAPNQRSFLSEILERYTKMTVVPIENGLRAEQNHLYVLQPGQRLTIREGNFQVEELSPEDRTYRLIDTFFYSLAADQKNHAVGVVLSGGDSDGALGLKAIKAEGGIAIVQTPESAMQPGMPRSSIAADHVDLVLPPAEIAIELGRLGHQFTRPEVRSLEDGHAAPDDEQSFQRILQLLRGLSGLDLRLYKPETVRRRIARRMLLLRQDRLSEYHRLLQMRTDELRLLQEDVLINVTHFFRDAGFWDSLRLNVLPVLLQDRPPEKPIRIWCAGCSTGEEAYSLAIVVLEYLSQNSLDTPVQIFGTDASDQSVETARIAIYPETIAGEVSPERLRRYFVKVDRGYQVSKRVRDTCIFARQNLCADPPFSHIDILSCRNVMIYFNQVLQRQVMLTFHYALEAGGYMLLGMSEGLRDYGDVFNTVDRKHKIYMKTGAHLPFNYEPPRTYALTHAGGAIRPPVVEIDNNIWPEQELQRAADRIVLARFGPPGLIIDDRMNVLQSRGQTSSFLDITPGAVSWNLLRVLKDGLVNDVRTAAQRAIRDNVPASTQVTLIDEQKGEQQIEIDVLPITSASTRPRSFLILFQALSKGGVERRLPEQVLQPELSADEKERLIAQLRQDLNSTRFHLQSLVEERDARNQELVSANEEIQSANEELQSTNEELETTKEELQSANEELQTVNDELQQRNNVLTQTGNDLTNLLNSVNIPLLMLNSEFQIRQFTPPMQRLLSVRPTDIGRSINEIRLQLSIEDLEPILNEVLESLGTREMEVQDKEGRWHLLRVRPYRTSDNKIEGLVVLLLDIDQLRSSQQQLVDARDFASSVVESVPVPIAVLNQDCTVRTANTSFRELTQMPASDLVGRSMPDLATLLWGIQGIREKLEDLLRGPAGSLLEFEHESTTAQRRTLLIKAQALSTDGNRVLLLMIEDISLRREAERLITQEKHALEGEIAIAARKLNRTQEELRGLTGHLFSVQEEERQRVARELHDDISQRLSLIEIDLQQILAQNGKGKKDGLEKLQALREQLSALNTDVRTMSHRLHPAILHDLGLPAALKALVTEFGAREGMPANYSSHDLPNTVPMEASIALYRIAQEALRNVAKHAGKTHVKVVLSAPDSKVELKIMDFGIGFDRDADPTTHGLGMISMQERARLAGGTLDVQSGLGQGTTITVTIPVDGHA